MRISSLSFFTTSLNGMQDDQAKIARLSRQIATGERLLAPKDDPLAAQRAMQLSSRIATQSQYVANQEKASLALKTEGVVLGAMNKSLTDARGMIMQSIGSVSQEIRNQHADMLSGYYLHFKDLLNSRDSDGNFIFAGFNTQQMPFQHTQVAPAIGNSAVATYNGTADGALLSSAGVRDIAIDDGRTVQVSDNLENVVKFPAPVTFTTSTAPGTVDAEDVLQTLDQLAVTLRDSNLTTAQVQANLNAGIDALTAALSRVGEIERRVTAAQVQVNDAQTTARSMLLLDQNALSDLTQVDKAAAIVEMQLRQTSLEAAQRAFAQTSQLGLFSYL